MLCCCCFWQLILLCSDEEASSKEQRGGDPNQAGDFLSDWTEHGGWKARLPNSTFTQKFSYLFFFLWNLKLSPHDFSIFCSVLCVLSSFPHNLPDFVKCMWSWNLPVHYFSNIAIAKLLHFPWSNSKSDLTIVAGRCRKQTCPPPRPPCRSTSPTQSRPPSPPSPASPSKCSAYGKTWWVIPDRFLIRGEIGRNEAFPVFCLFSRLSNHQTGLAGGWWLCH